MPRTSRGEAGHILPLSPWHLANLPLRFADWANLQPMPRTGRGEAGHMLPWPLENMPLKFANVSNLLKYAGHWPDRPQPRLRLSGHLTDIISGPDLASIR